MFPMMIKPSFNELRDLITEGNRISVYAELPNDLETPVSVLMKLSGSDPCFLLESVEGGERVARYSYVGVGVKEAFVLKEHDLEHRELTSDGLNIKPIAIPQPEPDKRRQGDVLDALQSEMQRYKFVEQPDLPPFCGGLVGYVGYDVVRQFERLPSTARDILAMPNAIFFLANTVIAIDHAWQRLLIITNIEVDEANKSDLESIYEEAVARIKTIRARLSLAPLPSMSANSKAECSAGQANKTQAEYEQMVQAAKEHIVAGDIYQVVLSRRIERRTVVHPFTIYRILRKLNPSPWMYFFNFTKFLTSETAQNGNDNSLYMIGASPEMHASFEGRKAELRPIAGTRWRGATEEEDVRLVAELLQDQKEIAEHTMLVDLGRNDLGRISEYGTVSVPEFKTVEKYSHVMHIVSKIEGEARPEIDAFDVLRVTFPAGTLTGAPKIRAMQIIEDLEGERRGPYGGCTGFFSFNGRMHTCITIRTVLMRGDKCFVQSGSGIVADSDPTREYEETVNKARALMQAIDEAEAAL